MSEELEEVAITLPEGEEPESTPGDEGLEGEQTPPEEAPADDDAGAHRSKGVERRIGQLTRRYRQAERENTALQGRLDALEQRIGPTPAPVRPTTDDFQTPEEYEDALFEWRDATQAHNQAPEPNQPPARTEEATRIERGLEDMLEVHPDAVDVVMEQPWPCNDATYEFLTSSEKGAELAYHLATNPAVASRINALSPAQAARELVTVEAELSATTHKPSATPPPPPGEPVTPSGSAVISDPDKMSSAQWRAWREGEIAKRA
jgi:hypothetical protein